jgi:hypothetical protein
MTSTIKVNNIQNQCGANIINESGNTITIGASGDTINLASGASQSGFGREGSVDWQTGSVKTATFTATSGEGYFCDTNGGAFEVDLPAGSAGAIVAIQDYRNTFDTANLTVDPNGSEKINGGAAGAPVTLSTEGQGVTFVYIDSTIGWRSVQDNTFATAGASFISATGGTITTANCGTCRIHTFTGPGTFAVSTTATVAANNVVSYLVMAGGAGGGAGSSGAWNAGGGGAGGFRESKSPVTPYTASPLISSTPVTVSATPYAIVVGAGGATRTNSNGGNGNVGGVSSFAGISSAGGGGGGDGANPTIPGAAGGSGGGAGSSCGGQPTFPAGGGGGNTPPVSPAQGNSGGASAGSTGTCSAGAGGGAGGNGSNGPGGARPGGPSVTSEITGSPVAYAAGGKSGDHPLSSTATSASANTGGGGQGAHGASQYTSGAGGSGIVIIRYKIA